MRGWYGEIRGFGVEGVSLVDGGQECSGGVGTDVQPSVEKYVWHEPDKYVSFVVSYC